MRIHTHPTRSRPLLVLLITSLGITCAAANEDLNDKSGKIFKVDMQTQTFELLTETLVDPQTREGKTRHSVEWNDETKFTKVAGQRDFSGIEGPVVVSFHMLNEEQAEAAEKGETFRFKVADVMPVKTSATGINDDRSRFVALFTPDEKNPRKGTVEVDGKQVPLSLTRPKSEIRILHPTTAGELNEGFWEATVYGKPSRDSFLLERAEISPLPDPRKHDDPDLPRVLVVGDSISMNYHEAAKSALEGKANYYRVEGNGGPSDRGVSTMELWLGDYTRPGLHWDVIQFNHGLHDLKQAYDEKSATWGEHQVAIEDYKKNLEQEISIMKKTGATLVWCSTTPVPNSSKGKYARRKGEAAVFNEAAMEVMRKHPDILINDLHKTITESEAMKNWWQGNDVHFWKKEQQEVLGNAVAEAIIRALDTRDENE